MKYEKLLTYIFNNSDYGKRGYLINDNKVILHKREFSVELFDIDDIDYLEINVDEDDLDIKIQTKYFNVNFNLEYGHRIIETPIYKCDWCNRELSFECVDNGYWENGAYWIVDKEEYYIGDKCLTDLVTIYLQGFDNKYFALHFFCYIHNILYVPKMVENVLKKDRDIQVACSNYKKSMNVVQYKDMKYNDYKNYRDIMTHNILGEPKVQNKLRIDKYVTSLGLGNLSWDDDNPISKQEYDFNDWVANEIANKNKKKEIINEPLDIHC